MSQINIKEIAAEYAGVVVKSLAISEKMGMMTGEEDLRNIIAAGIETALEDLIVKINPEKNEV
jgi:DnaJ-domain-containing protein 1